jgi:hypothetical protein
VTYPREQIQQFSVPAVQWIAVRTSAQVYPHLGCVFRSQFLVQIFPQPDDDLVTFHPLYPPIPLLMADTYTTTATSLSRFLDRVLSSVPGTTTIA